MSQSDYPMWINGGEVRSDRVVEVRVPYDGGPFATVYSAGEAHLKQAVEAAVAAGPGMRAMTLDARAAILRRASARLLAEKEEFATIISSESGKPIKEGRVEAERAASTLLFSAEEARRLRGEVVPMEALESGKGRLAMTVREPVGVIAAITPFNFPLNLSMHKIGPALAGGNTVVHKPASVTPVSALRLARLFSECGLPDGALNVVTGPGGKVGDFLVEHPSVRMITFTGSAEVGLRIRARAGMKRVTLELGNNSALLVEADADLADCVSRAVPGAFSHSGQVCISVQRIFVHDAVAEEFVERFAAAALALRRGHPLNETTEISSLITEAEARRVEEWVAEACAVGAHLRVGGERTAASVAPTVLTDVPEDERVFRQEAFGPVAAINRYSDLDDAIARVNASDYGLQAGIFTRDLEKAFRAARAVEVGGFLINDVPQYRLDHMPYGGVKLSGTGREGPRYAIEEMTEPKLISWRT
jgi:acyl-CoA reductase-like NAD-dependent aldehyde dehydrogenase